MRLSLVYSKWQECYLGESLIRQIFGLDHEMPKSVLREVAAGVMAARDGRRGHCRDWGGRACPLTAGNRAEAHKLGSLHRPELWAGLR